MRAFGVNNDGLVASTSNFARRAVYAEQSSNVSGALAIQGVVTPTSPGSFSAAVRGQNNGTGPFGIGVWGSQGGSGFGVYGTTATGRAVYGLSQATSGEGFGVYGESNSTSGRGVYGTAPATSGTTYGVQGQSDSTSGRGVYGTAPATSGTTYGVYGESASSNGRAVYGTATAVSGLNYGVYGRSSSSAGVGVFGEAAAGSGVNYGVMGASSSSSGWGVYSVGNARVDGDLSVTGTVSKGGGSFTIDHPLDPSNKYLQHSFVESPDMMNVYNGNVTTDADGEATVELPTWFEALNRDYRYQLTTIGGPVQAWISAEVAGNRFSIRTDAPHTKVSWQVTGIRQDAWANAHRIEVELDKSGEARGRYLYPVEHGWTETEGLAAVKRVAEAVAAGAE